MSVLGSPPKRGCGVGVQLSVSDESGMKISDTPSEWYGFDRETANQFSMDVIAAITGIVNGYRSEAGKSGKK